MADAPTTKPTVAQIEHERLMTLINSMNDGVVAIDETRHIILSNAGALSVLDLNVAMPGTPLHNVLKPFDKSDKPVDIDELIKHATRPTVNRDLRLHYSDGSTVNLYLAIAPVHLGFGQEGERGYVLQLRDITHEKSLEEERDEFISVTSHELRTPIAIAEGNISNAQLMVDRATNPTDTKTALKAAHDQMEFLSTLVNNLSTLSRAERGRLALEITPINVHKLVSELQANYQASATERGLQLLTDIDPKLELLYSSELYVHEILQNFITNAIKYTDKGHVLIAAKAQPAGVLFIITDTGIGISKSDQAKIFTKFFRSEDYQTRKTSGTGLGLYVIMKLANLLQAHIDVKSQVNAGSTFTIFVPNLKQDKPA